MKNVHVRTVVILGVLTALEIVLNRFLSINTEFLKIGFSFVPVAVAAMLYGPLAAGAVAALGDLLGALLFPIGAYFPGFTLTAFLTGVVLGLCLREKQTAARVLIAVGINQLILSLFLNTFWLSVLYESPYWPTFVSRLVQCAILTPVQFTVILLIGKALIPYVKRYAQ